MATDGTYKKGEAARRLDILRTQSLATLVLQELERMILDGELKAGERVNEKALAEIQNVSRGPVREAVRRLEEAGLVEVVVNRGVFVRKLEIEEALNLYDIRAALLGLAGQLLVKRLNPDDIRYLYGLVDRMDTLAEARDLESYYSLNLEFHATLMKFTGNKRLADLDAAMAKELYLFRRRSLVTGSGLIASSGEHRRIVDALANGDAEWATAVMRNHVLAGRRRLFKALPESENKNEDHKRRNAS